MLESQEKKYRPRLIDPVIGRQLQASGAVLIEGPKWCGKTWTGINASQSQIYLQAPDKREGYLQAAQSAPSLLLRGHTPRLIDEWQTIPVIWDTVRHEVDIRQATGQFILTGSAVPFSGATQHTGTGRIARTRMRPMSLLELGQSSGEVSLVQLFSGECEVAGINPWGIEELAVIIARGGWPSSLQLTDDAALLQMQNYIEAIVHEDISRVDEVERNPQRAAALLRTIARNTATEATKRAILSDLAFNDETFSMPTVNDYIATLERLFIVENLPAWNPALRSKTPVRTSHKWHFVDPALAVAALGASPEKLLSDFETFGYLFESLCVRDMRIYAETIGGKVFHYRDKSNLESDMVVVLRDGRWGAVEVKMGSGAFDQAATSLEKFTNRVDQQKMQAPSFRMILTATEYAYQRSDGTYVVPLGTLAP